MELKGFSDPTSPRLRRASIEGKVTTIGIRLAREKLPTNLHLCQIQTKLDTLRHSIRKLRTYEEIRIVFTSYVRFDGVYRCLPAGGNDGHRTTC